MVETRDADNTTSRSRSTMGVGLQMRSDTMFENTCIPTEDEHLSVTTHTTRSKINTLMFLRGKTPMGKHPRPQPMWPLGAIY
jgi:hypothetical protein